VRRDAKQDDDDGVSQSARKRGWKLDALDVDAEADAADTDAADRAIFEDQLATDRDMRAAVNLYADGGALGASDDPDAVRLDELLAAAHLDATPAAAVDDAIDDAALARLE
jgi:hypothetical protein